MHTWTLEIGKATVTVDDEGNWAIVDNPGGHDGRCSNFSTVSRLAFTPADTSRRGEVRQGSYRQTGR